LNQAANCSLLNSPVNIRISLTDFSLANTPAYFHILSKAKEKNILHGNQFAYSHYYISFINYKWA
jgi:hypothetical protein